jgi:hypothetical protein
MRKASSGFRSDSVHRMGIETGIDRDKIYEAGK